jgi:hypothetical protein
MSREKELTAVEWLLDQLDVETVLTRRQLSDVINQAKVIEKNQRRKDFVNGYKERAKLSGKVFDEISEALANKLFEKQEQ